MPKRNLAWILVIGMIALLMWQLPHTIAGRDSVLKAFGPLVDVRVQINRNFVTEVNDDLMVHRAVDAGIRAMVSTLNDPFSGYMSRDDYERFEKRRDGFYGGIGIDVWTTEDGLEVLGREPHSPAVQVGILPGDVITHIDGVSVKDMPLDEVVANQLNGPSDTPIRLRLYTPTTNELITPRELTVYRAIIKLESVRGWSRDHEGNWRFILDPVQRIGYVRLTKFTTDVDERLDAIINRLLRENLRGLVLDLRENTGGLLKSALEVTDRFLESGLMVRTSGRRADEKQWFALREGTYPHFAMVVLINGSTASAAEIVAGSLRDHKRAVLVGERSFGKGSVQEVVELSDGNGAIKLTTAYYYLPGGQCIHRTPENMITGTWGVAPTIPVNLTESQRKRCLATWRNLARESAAVDKEAAPVTTTAASDDMAEHDAVRELLSADIQLAKGLEYLEKRLDTTTTKPAEDTPVSTTQESTP